MKKLVPKFRIVSTIGCMFGAEWVATVVGDWLYARVPRAQLLGVA